MEYTYNSTDPDKYNEVDCPICYYGASVQVKWYVSFIQGKSNVVLLDEDDYFICNDVKYNVQKCYKSLDSLSSILTEIFNQVSITIDITTSGKIMFSSENDFTITDMSTRLSYACGLHYTSNINIEAGFSIVEGKYIYTAKAVPFDYLTPIWYAVSNLGMPNQIASMTQKYKIYYPAVAAKINNTFADEQSLCISNTDYQTISYAASLNNLKISIVDANMKPIKFLSPLFITVNLEEVPLDDSIKEALAEQPPNKVYIEQVKKLLEQNQIKLTSLIAKWEKGISAEPDIIPFEEKPQEDQPPPLSTLTISEAEIITPDEIQGTTENTPEIIAEPNINKDDDHTEDKEKGIIKEENKQIEEEHINEANTEK